MKRRRMMSEGQILKRLEFPAYCVRVLENGLVAIAGGGGVAKTGVANCIEIGTIDFDPSLDPTQRCRFNSLHIFEPNDAIMKFSTFKFERNLPNRKANAAEPLTDIYIAAALNESIEVYKIQPKVERPDEDEVDTVRNRKSKEKKAPSVYKTSACLELANVIKLLDRENEQDTEAITDESINTISVCIVPNKSKNNSDSKNSVLICAGTSKGNIHVWSLSKPNDSNNKKKGDTFKVHKVHRFLNAHGKQEIDEMQVNTEKHLLLSIGKDNRCVLWSLDTFSKVAELLQTPAENMRMKHARFADEGKYLYTTFIPRIRGGGRDLSSYVQKWSAGESGFKPEATHRIRNTILTSMQTSKDGRFVSLGDYEGRVYLLNSKFATVVNFKKLHSSVVTDLAFYHDSVHSFDVNKLVLTLSIDRTLQCYSFINDSTYLNHSNLLLLNKIDVFSTFTFRIYVFVIVLVLFFCYFFTYFE